MADFTCIYRKRKRIYTDLQFKTNLSVPAGGLTGWREVDFRFSVGKQHFED